MDLKRPESLRPYVSLDLETTGLDTEKSKVIQVSMVLDNGEYSIKDLPHATFFVKWPHIDYGEPYALGMNGWIFKQLTGQEEAQYPIHTPSQAEGLMYGFLEGASLEAEAWDKEMGIKHPQRRLQIAGKNASGFDYPLLKSNFSNSTNYVGRFRPGLFVSHQFLDIGAEFADIFGRNPGLNTINKLIGYKPVTHDALEDALNVVAARRWKFNHRSLEWISPK